MGESILHGSRIGISMLPTLVFTLVIAEILRDRFALPVWVHGGLVIYTLLNTLIPAIVLKAKRVQASPPEAGLALPATASAD
jgi:hypothetical protein